MVKHLGMHFTWFINYNGTFVNIEDLCDKCEMYDSLDKVYNFNYNGWFFAVHKKKRVVVSHILRGNTPSS